VPAVKPTKTVRLNDGDTLDLTAGLVRRTVNGHTFVMYAFNGMVPGPLIRVQQRASIVVRFHNRIDLPSTVHWHGLRHDNRDDGVPGLTQAEVAPGKSFTYHVRFPDAGVYWYHPHVREDIEQAMGLFGNMLVDAPERDYYAPANQEQALVLDDLLINGDTLIPFGKEAESYALMGRVGNVLTVNGETRYRLAARTGEVVRFYVTNVSSARTYNLSFGNARMKVVAGDVSRFEHEEWVPSIVLAPAERYVVEVRFDKPGRYTLVNAVQAINHYLGEFEAEVDTLGTVTVNSTPARPDYSSQFATLRAIPAVTKDIDPFRGSFDKAPDLRLTLTVRTTALPLATVQFMNVDTAYFAPVEWVDGMRHELALHEQAGHVGASRRCHRQREHGYRLAREGWGGGQAPHLQRPEVVPSDAAPDPPAWPAHVRRFARRGAHTQPRLEGHGNHPGGFHGRSADRRLEPWRLDAALPHRRAPRRRHDGGDARGWSAARLRLDRLHRRGL
jgi:FtsP/CotA-like multicopper oxidase with cupredoxin domain